MPVITFETLVHAPIERCFDLNLDVDVHAAAFADTGERALAGVTHGRLGPGDTVTWEAMVRLADRLFLRRYVERLLRQRATAVRAACEAL